MTPPERLAAVVLGFLLGVIVTVTVTYATIHAQAERPLSPWKTERCYTNRCIETLLNRLPPDRAHEAKITTWRDSSYVWYRE